MRVIAYVRVSTNEQADSGAGLAAQRDAIATACTMRSWTVVETIEDAGFSAGTLNRPGITRALDLLHHGMADGLVVAKLDRLSRSLLDFSMLMEQARKEKWNLVALDLGVDTSTPAGEMMAAVLATFSQFERRLIGQRTKDALAQKRSQGVRLGRPANVPADVVGTIVGMRSAGATYACIAEHLNDANVPTAQGGQRWHPSTVHGVVRGALEPRHGAVRDAGDHRHPAGGEAGEQRHGDVGDAGDQHVEDDRRSGDQHHGHGRHAGEGRDGGDPGARRADK